MQPEMFQELATAVFCCYLSHPGRKREHESNIGSRMPTIQLAPQKGDVFQLKIIENRKYQGSYC